MSFLLKLSSKTFFNHLTFWIILSFAIHIIDPSPVPLKIEIGLVVLAILNYSFLYYFCLHFIFPRFYTKKLLLVLICILAYIVFVLFGYFIYDVFLYHFTGEKGFSEMNFTFLLINQLFLYSFILVAALGAYQSKIGIEKLKLKNIKERELKLRELDFLRNQFNTNITFDFLNHCHDVIKNESENTAHGINTFSKMLLYSLNNRISEKTLLKNEIQYIENFIKIYKLLHNNILVTFEITNPSKYIYIFPGILIGFVENAFKHGDLHSPTHPITITLNASEEQINFKVSNKKNKHKLIESSGIGNHNLKQQLELLYKNKYKLRIDDQEDTYACEIKLLLK